MSHLNQIVTQSSIGSKNQLQLRTQIYIEIPFFFTLYSTAHYTSIDLYTVYGPYPYFRYAWLYGALKLCYLCWKHISCMYHWIYRFTMWAKNMRLFRYDCFLLVKSSFHVSHVFLESYIAMQCIIMGAMVSQITSHMIVCSAVYPGANERKHQSSASLAFVRGIHRWPANSPHKGPVTRNMFHLMTSSWSGRYG